MLSKGRSEKKSQKRRKKRNAGVTVKTVIGAVGPFKKKKTRHQNIRKSENETGGPNTPDESKGTVADFEHMVGVKNMGNS